MGLYENFKEVVGVVQKLDNIGLYQKILNIQAQALELSNANIEKDKKIKELEEKLDDSQKMKFDGKFYYIEGEEYPYCPGCWGAKKRKTHLVIDKHASGTRYKCPVIDCKFEHFMKKMLGLGFRLLKLITIRYRQSEPLRVSSA